MTKTHPQQTNWSKIKTLLSHEGEIANVELAYRFIDSLQMGKIAVKDATIWKQTQNKQLLPIILEAAPHLLDGQHKLDLSGVFRGGKPVPSGLAQIQGLKELDLSGNEFTELPTCVQQMSGLRVLNLQHNWLVDFPRLERPMPKLQRLNLGHNHIERLPKAVAQLPALRHLSLAHNYIDAVSAKGIAALPKLQSLDLKANCLVSLPPSLLLGLPQKLDTLDLSENPLKRLPPRLYPRALAQGLLIKTDTHLTRLCKPRQTLNNLPPRKVEKGQILRRF
jgi:Leucine-rich repeat (LRR) protein